MEVIIHNNDNDNERGEDEAQQTTNTTTRNEEEKKKEETPKKNTRIDKDKAQHTLEHFLGNRVSADLLLQQNIMHGSMYITPLKTIPKKII